MIGKKLWLLVVPAMLPMARPAPADDRPDQPTTASEAWERLVAEYDEAVSQWTEKARGDESTGGAIMISPGGSMPPHPTDAFRPRVRAYAEEQDGKPAAIPALAWLVTNDFGFLMSTSTGDSAKWALERLHRDHATDPTIKDHLDGLEMATMSIDSDSLLAFLDTVAAKNPDKEARGRARLTAAGILSDDSPLFAMMSGLDGRADRTEQMKRAEEIFRTLAKEYAGSDIGKEAKDRLFVIDHLQVGMTVPHAVGKDVDGHEIKLSDFRGKVVMVVFWATWCKGCMQEIPHERELMKTHAGKPFTIVGINVDMSASVCRDAIKKEGITWPNIYDGGPDADGIASKWRVRSFPTVILLDHEGVIRHKNRMPFQIDADIDALLVEALAAKRG